MTYITVVIRQAARKWGMASLDGSLDQLMGMGGPEFPDQTIFFCGWVVEALSGLVNQLSHPTSVPSPCCFSCAWMLWYAITKWSYSQMEKYHKRHCSTHTILLLLQNSEWNAWRSLQWRFCFLWRGRIKIWMGRGENRRLASMAKMMHSQINLQTPAFQELNTVKIITDWAHFSLKC